MPNEMDFWTGALLTFATTYLLHSTLLLGGTWAVLRLARVTSWTLRERLWKLAAVLPFLTASISLTASMSQPIVNLTLIGLPDRNPLMPAAAPTISETARPPGPTTTGSLTIAPEETVMTDGDAERFEDADIATAASSDSKPKTVHGTLPRFPITSSPELPSRLDARPFLLVAACSPIVAFLVGGFLRIVCQSVVFHRRLRACRPIERGLARELLDSVLHQAGMRRRIRLLSSSAATQPAAFGLVQWTIVLPAGVVPRLKRDELEALLTHEAAHLIRGDAVWLWIGRVLCACFAFQPLNFAARQGWRTAAEFQCDRWAVCITQNRFALARSLANVAEWKAAFPRRSTALLAIGSRSNLSERIELLVNDGAFTDSWDTGRRRRLISAGALLTTAAFVFLAPRTTLLAETSPSSTRTVSIPEHETGSRLEATAHDNAALQAELALLDDELRQLDAGIKRVDELLQQKAVHNPALRDAANRLTARSALLLKSQRRLTALSRTVLKNAPVDSLVPAKDRPNQLQP
jgi:beta-lactamase regulating signal transducer with metallopeptidase domain